MIKQAILKLQQQTLLSEQEAKQLFEALLLDETPKEQIAAVMILLNLQMNNIALFAGILSSMREHMLQVPFSEPLFDIVGTGGDGANTFNISTGSALLLAACGVKVAKHGNRAKTSQCGSADVLEALNISIENSPEQVQQSLSNNNFGFCLANYYHPSWKKLNEVRRALAVPCVFNFMGPLVNPAKAEYLMLGVAKPELVDLFAKILEKQAIKRALIFHSKGLDELTPATTAHALLVENGETTTFPINAQDYGLSACSIEDLKGGDKAFNKSLLIKAFSGETGPVADTLALNAGVGLFLRGHANNIQEGIKLAKEKLASRETLQLIEALKHA